MADQLTTEQKAPVEHTKNCGSCGKPVKKLKRYYRNGKYYCNKVCFKKSKNKKEA